MALTRVTSDLQDTYNYPIICDDLSPLFDGITLVFNLKVDGNSINTVVDSRNAQVYTNGKLLRPYISERVMPWIMEYTPNGDYRITGSKIIFYNPPAARDICTIVITSASTYTQKILNSYSPRPIAFGD